MTDPEAVRCRRKLDSCISGQMSTWRFPIPRDKDGQPTDVSFHVALALRPS